MPIEHKKLEELLKSQYPDGIIEVIDLAGDNNHYSVSIIDEAFNNLSRIQQHQHVYNSLDGLLDNELHAMQLKTKGTL